MLRFERVSLAFLLGFFILGCGGGPTPLRLYPVKGTVTVKGKPLSGCFINLSTENPPKGGEGQYSGKLNEDGEFKITTEKGKNGAPAGKYKVTFYLPPDEAMKAMMGGRGKKGYQAGSFPPEYGSAKTSKKEIEITPSPPGPPNDLLIEIP